MAEVKRSFRDRAVDRVARAVVGDRFDELQRRLLELEAEVQECRQLNVRLAEVTDLVEQLLLPAAARDDAAAGGGRREVHPVALRGGTCMAAKIFLHIGLPKTATTYLQTILWGNTESSWPSRGS